MKNGSKVLRSFEQKVVLNIYIFFFIFLKDRFASRWAMSVLLFTHYLPCFLQVVRTLSRGAKL